MLVGVCTMSKKTTSTAAPAPVDVTRNPDGSLKPVSALIQEATAAAVAAAYPVATAEQLRAAVATVATVEFRGSTPDPIGGRPGSKAAGHNALFLALPKAVLSRAVVQAAVESLEFTDTRGNCSRGKYNPCHMDNLVSEIRTQGVPAVARVPGGYTLNPLWLARYTAATGNTLRNVGTPAPAPAGKVRKPVATAAPAPAPAPAGKPGLAARVASALFDTPAPAPAPAAPAPAPAPAPATTAD